MVFAQADVVAGVVLGAALANENLTSGDCLSTETLDSEVLRVGVTTVFGRACTFFVDIC